MNEFLLFLIKGTVLITALKSWDQNCMWPIIYLGNITTTYCFPGRAVVLVKIPCTFIRARVLLDLLFFGENSLYIHKGTCAARSTLLRSCSLRLQPVVWSPKLISYEASVHPKCCCSCDTVNVQPPLATYLWCIKF